MNLIWLQAQVGWLLHEPNEILVQQQYENNILYGPLEFYPFSALHRTISIVLID